MLDRRGQILDPNVLRMVEAMEAGPGAANALHVTAETLWRAGDLDSYAELVRRAYLLEPKIKIPLGTGPTETAERSNALLDRGVLFAHVIASFVAAEARLGRRDAVERLMDYRRLLRQGRISPPAGLAEQELNRQVADEIKARLSYRDAPRNKAVHKGWRANRLSQNQGPALRALWSLLHDAARDYIASLPDDKTHPFVRSCPEDYVLEGWAVASGKDTFLESHMHPHAWATGVYYVVQPEVSRAPDSDCGWLHVGPPDGSASGLGRDVPADAWERRSIEPAAGTFVLMPAYFWHATRPMGVDQERICIAFELQPSEFSSALATRR
jgi:hypothetical protein